MDIDKVIKKIYKKGDFSHKRKIYDSIDADIAFERFSRKIQIKDNNSTTGSKRNKIRFINNRPYRKYIAIAASLLIPIVFATSVILIKDSTESALISNSLPGTTMAYIKNSKGDIIELDSTDIDIHQNGLTASVKNGELIIENAAEIEMTSIYVPRGGEYKLTLSDGTRVHLNSDSKITFPSRFTGSSRDVELIGEAYFEVAHDNNSPFIVHLGSVSVKQYGTHFNINAYEGESKIITLIEGSIGVTSGSNEYRLTPGRQACINGEDMKISNADVDAVMGWTEGMFKFDGEKLADIATTLSRWYNVDVCVDASLSTCCFTGSLSRESNLRDILDAICEITNTKISIKDNTIQIKK
jgi:hypothetical protein